MKNIDDILKENKAKPEPYKVPDGYFEDFTARLNAKIDAIEADKVTSRKEEKVILTPGKRLWLSLKPVVYVAASVMVLFCASYVFVQIKSSSMEGGEQTAQIAQNTQEQDARLSVDKIEEDYYAYFVEDEDEDYMFDLLSYND